MSLTAAVAKSVISMEHTIFSAAMHVKNAYSIKNSDSHCHSFVKTFITLSDKESEEMSENNEKKIRQLFYWRTVPSLSIFVGKN